MSVEHLRDVLPEAILNDLGLEVTNLSVVAVVAMTIVVFKVSEFSMNNICCKSTYFRGVCLFHFKFAMKETNCR
jgi:hypothetical protein